MFSIETVLHNEQDDTNARAHTQAYTHIHLNEQNRTQLCKRVPIQCFSQKPLRLEAKPIVNVPFKPTMGVTVRVWLDSRRICGKAALLKKVTQSINEINWEK